jgi:FMN phosphatase YigB (HAD superfamily)
MSGHPSGRGALRALLIDFGGTLFLPLGGDQWLAQAAREAGIELSAAEHRRLAGRLGTEFHLIPAPGCDLSPAAHEHAILPVLESLVSDKKLAAALYDLESSHEFWRLRNGARELLDRAGQQDLRVIVVSNIPWDLRPLFSSAGVRDQIQGFALSCELGVEKPDRLIFEHALGLAGCSPAQALFVGDDRVCDSGALDLGIPAVLVPRATDDADHALFLIADWLTSS